MKPIIHNYSRLAGKTVHWDTSDNKDAYAKNLQTPTTYRRLQYLGFLNTQIDYCYNSHGFRTAEFDRSFDAVCFGCSFTMGTGVHSQDTWPEQLAHLPDCKWPISVMLAVATTRLLDLPCTICLCYVRDMLCGYKLTSTELSY